MYRYFNLDVNDHFFTTDFTEFYLGVYGYISEDFEGYILSAPSDDFETD